MYEEVRHQIQSNSLIDAKNYTKTYDELTKFCTCALCGEEGPPKDAVELGDCTQLIKASNLKILYETSLVAYQPIVHGTHMI